MMQPVDIRNGPDAKPGNSAAQSDQETSVDSADSSGLSYDPRAIAVRPAATVIVVRDFDTTSLGGLEVLLCQRRSSSPFVANMQVFPGGGIDPEDSPRHIESTFPYPGGPSLEAAQNAAVREAREETSLELGTPAALPLIGRWITPALAPRRYDTLFFLSVLPQGQEPVPDETEVVACSWWSPWDAVDAWEAGELEFVTPTLRFLMSLQDYRSSADALAAARQSSSPGNRVRVDDETGWPWLPADEEFWSDGGLRRTFGWVGLGD